MEREWSDGQPIYRQLRDRVVAMILDGVLAEGDPLPSVRTVAAEWLRWRGASAELAVTVAGFALAVLGLRAVAAVVGAPG